MFERDPGSHRILAADYQPFRHTCLLFYFSTLYDTPNARGVITDRKVEKWESLGAVVATGPLTSDFHVTNTVGAIKQRLPGEPVYATSMQGTMYDSARDCILRPPETQLMATNAPRPRWRHGSPQVPVARLWH